MARALAPTGATAEVDEALNALYEAVLMPETWASAMHAFARATGSVGCLFYPKDQAQALVHLPVSPDIKDFIDAYVREGQYRRDIRALRGWPALARTGKRVITDDDLMTPAERRSSPYLQEFQRRWKLLNWAAIAFRVNGEPWAMPLLRSERQGSISKQHARICAAASPHLGRIVELATLAGQQRISDRLELLYRSGRAAALIDWRGCVSGLTPQAQALLGSDLTLRNGRLEPRHRDSHAALARLIAAAVNEPAAAVANTGVAIVRAQGHPIFVRAIPLGGMLSEALAQACVLLLFEDLDRKRRPSADLLRSTFGLTEAEARLAAQLSGGEAIEKAADVLGVAKETARNQLKSVFAKTGVHRQAELVALLAGLIGAFF